MSKMSTRRLRTELFYIVLRKHAVLGKHADKTLKQIKYESHSPRLAFEREFHGDDQNSIFPYWWLQLTEFDPCLSGGDCGCDDADD